MSHMHFKDHDLLVMGETFVEFLCDGEVSLANSYIKDIGGADTYVAITAAKLGSNVSFLSSVARDPWHNLIRERFLDHGVNIDHVDTHDGYNGIYFMSTREPKFREYLYHRPGNAAQKINPNMIYDSLLNNCKIVYASSELQSVSKNARHAIFKAFHSAHINDSMVAYDPNLRLHRWSLDDAKESMWSVLPLLDVILPSAPEESKALFGYERPLDVVGFLWDRGVSIVAVKNGANGCMIGYDGKIEELSVPDDRGSVEYPGLIGSVFNGAFLSSIAQGNDPFTAAEFALQISSLKGQTGNGVDSIPSKK